METITFKVQEVPDAFRERAALRKWLNSVARDHGLQIQELNYVLMTDDALLEFNQRYLGHDEYTDVITFDGQRGLGLCGDVLMSYDRIRENAATFGTSARQELSRVMVHGLLHLLGHSDKTRAQRAHMRELEDKYLAQLHAPVSTRKGHRP
jgi:probable rRNA maturation factor